MDSEQGKDEIRVEIVEGKKKYDFTFLRQLTLLVLGSFIFVGMIEGYKSDLGRDKDLVKEYYRPARDAYTACSPHHNSLFLKYGELAGSYQLMFDELRGMLDGSDITMSKDYQVFSVAIVKSNSSLKKQIKSLEEEVERCRLEVYSSYEELALVTGTFDKYSILSEQHFQKLNGQQKLLKESIPQEFKEMNNQDLVGFFKGVLTMDLSSPQGNVQVKNTFDKFAKPLIEYEIAKMKSEQEIFMENQRFHLSLREIFLAEINKRNSQGFMRWLI